MELAPERYILILIINEWIIHSLQIDLFFTESNSESGSEFIFVSSMQ